jgi:phosphohistidine phosphatase
MRPLTPDGAEKFRKAVVGMAAFGVEIDLILTSPLVRCRQTAELLATGLPAGRARRRSIRSRRAPATPPSSRKWRVAKRPHIALVGHGLTSATCGALLGLKRRWNRKGP